MTYDVCMGTCQSLPLIVWGVGLLKDNRIPPVHHNVIHYSDLQTLQPLEKRNIRVTKGY